MYKLDEENGIVVKTNQDGTETFIPLADGNSDYQRYLRWLEDPTAEDEAQSL